MNRTVIFDLDGLLIDSEVISYRLYQDLVGEYGYSFTVEDYAQTYSGKTGTANIEALVERFKLPISVQEGLDLTSVREEEYLMDIVPLKTGAKELLRYLQKNKYKIVLASSSTRERALHILKQHEAAGYFDEMVFGPEVERGKPYPDIFLRACEKVCADPGSSLVLEDSEAGIQAAYSAGIPVICVPDMKSPGERFRKMTEKVLPSLSEVMFYLEDHAVS